MSKIPARILREYDIRGTVGKNLDEAIAYQIGQKFALSMLAEARGAVAVCRDGRLSSESLAKAVIEGIRKRGVNVIDIGLGPTPMLYFAVNTFPEATGGIMVTGSHNPPKDNGFKMTLKSRPFFGSDIQSLASLDIPGSEGLMGSYRIDDVRASYAHRMLQSAPQFAKRPMRIAWDAGHGAAAEIAKLLTVSGGIPAEHIMINCEIDGTFPAHHPDPTVPKNLEQLISVVKEKECDLGIAFDGDGDRIGVVDGQGRIIWGDQLMVFLARDVLKNNPGATIIADVKASQVLFKDIKKHGGNPIMWRTGHSLIKSKIYETDAKLAGEMSGHIFFNDDYYGYDDGLYAAVRLIRLLLDSDKSLAELYDELPKAINTPEMRIKCSDSKKFEIVDAIIKNLKAAGAKIIDVDGVRVNTKKGWWLIRASNTQPAIVARAEANTQADLDLLIAEMQKHLSKYELILK